MTKAVSAHRRCGVRPVSRRALPLHPHRNAGLLLPMAKAEALAPHRLAHRRDDLLDALPVEGDEDGAGGAEGGEDLVVGIDGGAAPAVLEVGSVDQAVSHGTEDCGTVL